MMINNNDNNKTGFQLVQNKNHHVLDYEEFVCLYEKYFYIFFPLSIVCTYLINEWNMKQTNWK